MATKKKQHPISPLVLSVSNPTSRTTCFNFFEYKKKTSLYVRMINPVMNYDTLCQFREYLDFVFTSIEVKLVRGKIDQFARLINGIDWDEDEQLPSTPYRIISGFAVRDNLDIARNRAYMHIAPKTKVEIYFFIDGK